MKRVLYEARSAKGVKITNYIECHTNADALQRLKNRGYSDIKFHSDARFSAERQYLDGKSVEEVAQIAKFELARRLQGSKLSSRLIIAFKKDKRFLLLFLITFLLGFYTPYFCLSFFVCFSFLYYVTYIIQKYKIPDAYQNALRAHALGDHKLFFKSKKNYNNM